MRSISVWEFYLLRTLALLGALGTLVGWLVPTPPRLPGPPPIRPGRPASLETWFTPLALVGADQEGVLHFQATDRFHLAWLEEHYTGLIARVCQSMGYQEYQLSTRPHPPAPSFPSQRPLS